MTDIVIPIGLGLIALVAVRLGVLRAIARRPLAVFVTSAFVGAAVSAIGAPTLPEEAMRVAAQFCVATFAFMAALQCRLSRLSRISHGAFRLSLLSPILVGSAFALTSFVIFPGLGAHGAALLGTVVMAIGAPSQPEPLLSAPIAPQTKVAARVEAAAATSVIVAVFAFVEAAAETAGPGLWTGALFRGVAGFALGGAIGLLAAAQTRRAVTGSPLLPLAVIGVAWGLGVIFRLDPLLAVIGAGITFSEDANIRGIERTWFWRRTEAAILPVAALLFGLSAATAIFPGTLLGWVVGIVAVYVFRPLARALVLSGTRLAIRDRVFLVWWAGAPGAAAALLFVSVNSRGAALDAGAAAAASAAITLGFISQRIVAKPLIRRLVRRTVTAQKPRFETL